MSEPTYLHATDGAARGRLRLLQLYPRDMNIYGDWGNALVLARRAQWAGYDVDLLSYDPGDEFPDDVDLLVGGGGQDSGQERIKEDLVERGPQLRAWASDGMPMLVICGLYQLFGHRFITGTGAEIPGISILDAETVAGSGRLIGNITLESKDFGRVVGYENHSGLTTLAAGVAGVGGVRAGDGDCPSQGTGRQGRGPVFPQRGKSWCGSPPWCQYRWRPRTADMNSPRFKRPVRPPRIG